MDASAGGSYGFVQQAPGQEFVAVDDRSAAPVLGGTTLDGSALDLGSYLGRIVVVNFWASWCAPCRAETPDLVELAGEYPEVAFVGVNEKDSESAAKAFVRDFEVTYPSLVDKIGTLAARWPVPPGLPSTFVLDPEGQLAVRFTGGVLGDELRPVLDQLVAQARGERHRARHRRPVAGRRAGRRRGGAAVVPVAVRAAARPRLPVLRHRPVGRGRSRIACAARTTAGRDAWRNAGSRWR